GLGELVEFRFHGDGPPARIVQGIQLICDSWFYCIEWMPKQFAFSHSQSATPRCANAIKITDN
ncbi:DUF1392 family protein, partial [Nostoc flagelliforme FACHB-838]